MFCDVGSTCVGYESNLTCSAGATCINYGSQKPRGSSAAKLLETAPIPSNVRINNYFKRDKFLIAAECVNGDINAPVNGGDCVFSGGNPAATEQHLTKMIGVQAYRCKLTDAYTTECYLKMDGKSMRALYDSVNKPFH